MNNILKNIRENLPIITLLYYLLCGLTIWIYYSSFNIDILSYCNIKDIIAFPIDALFISVFTPIYLFSILTLTKGVESKLRDWIKTNLNLRLFELILLVLFLLLLAFIGFRAPYMIYYVALLFSIFLICLGLLRYVLYYEKIEHLSVICGFILFLLFFIDIKVDNIKHRSRYLFKSTHTSFRYNSEIVSTTIDKRWIGQTSEYIFIYNRNSKSTEVYKMSEIDSLRFRVDN